jgi:hypothetical protein
VESGSTELEPPKIQQDQRVYVNGFHLKPVFDSSPAEQRIFIWSNTVRVKKISNQASFEGQNEQAHNPVHFLAANSPTSSSIDHHSYENTKVI